MSESVEKLIWFIIMIPCSALFSGIGIFAWKSRKPMWFWSGSNVKPSEISDIPAYNRANGKMWIAFSLVMWAATFVGLWNETVAAVLLVAGCVGGIPVLVVVYKRIYKKYKA